MGVKKKPRIDRIDIRTTKGRLTINHKKGTATMTGSFANDFVKQAIAEQEKEKK